MTYRNLLPVNRFRQTRPLRFIPAVVKQPGDGEPVLLAPFLRLPVAGRSHAVEQFKM